MRLQGKFDIGIYGKMTPADVTSVVKSRLDAVVRESDVVEKLDWKLTGRELTVHVLTSSGSFAAVGHEITKIADQLEQDVIRTQEGHLERGTTELLPA